MKCVIIPLSKAAKWLNINILSKERIEIVEDKVKCGDIALTFFPEQGFFQKNFVLGLRFRTKNLVAWESARGRIETGQIDTCIIINVIFSDLQELLSNTV